MNIFVISNYVQMVLFISYRVCETWGSNQIQMDNFSTVYQVIFLLIDWFVWFSNVVLVRSTFLSLISLDKSRCKNPY